MGSWPVGTTGALRKRTSEKGGGRLFAGSHTQLVWWGVKPPHLWARTLPVLRHREVLGRKGEARRVGLRQGLSARTGVELAPTGATPVTGSGWSKATRSGARKAPGTRKRLHLFVFKAVKS